MYDQDLGSGGLLLLPDQPGPHTQMLVGAGKGSVIYLADRNDLSQFHASGDQVVQALPGAIGEAFDTPAYFNNTIYYHAASDTLKAFALSNGKIVTPPASQSATVFNFPGAVPSVSANGTTNGIVWESQFGTPGILHAYDAANVAHELYNSNQASLRDQFGAGVKFAVPTIANGKVYVGTQSGLAVFGLFPVAATPPAAPSVLSATAVSSSSVNLKWQDNATNEISFKIERSTDNAVFTQIAMVGTGVTSFSDNSAAAGTTYYYRVRASNLAGDSAYSNTASATTPTAQGSLGLVGYWRFDEGSGTTTADSSGNGDTGTLSGEVSWVAGKIGPSALDFHGTGVADSHVAVPDTPRCGSPPRRASPWRPGSTSSACRASGSA